ncbi:ATPase [Bacillus sp. FJAT-27264]|uniref:ParA family protein n=1 Tax=Paenibacillus sp. (strain DSM 101736 / FJAT-27264) TaxID=1850362 RepID=UPI000807F7AA|nr:ParA family protein [Bacillus sp. FJAT-27264]OBZ14627.1 ATPase [Bacillus sp. FJAT-27264]
MSEQSIRIYSFYNNKGGVGKTTLSFNAATLYAQQNPKTQVLVIDMCPQANISQYLLGGGRTGYLTNQKIQAAATRKNVVGFIDWLLKGNSNFSSINTRYSIPVSRHNKNIASNLFLVAGDSFLESLSLALNYAVINPANTRAWLEYMTAIKRLCSHEFMQEEYENLVVFIDCNPSFSIYTQMALASSDFIVIPMMADFSSIDGIKGMFTMLYDEYPTPALKTYAENIITFNKQVKQFGIKLPKIYEFVFNNFTSHLGISSAFQALKNELNDFCFGQFNKFNQLFALPNDPITTKEAWSNLYVSDVKDFHTAGKVSASKGIPIHMLPYSSKYNMPDGTEISLPKNNYAQAVDDIYYFVGKLK